MIQEIENHIFDNQYKCDALPTQDDYIFLFRKEDKGPDTICLGDSEDDKMIIPTFRDVTVDICDLIFLFSIDDRNFYLPKHGVNIKCPEGFEYKSNRFLRKSEPKELAFAAMTACHLNEWYNCNRFCGKCGTQLEYGDNERMMRCPKCGNVIYPRINPAVTVALVHDDKLLVSKYRGRAQTNMYALIAGFVEIGESAEECAIRELYEEVGLKAKNIKYFGSQPWGFAGNLQIGYWAELDGDDKITLDEEELSNAFFISRDELEYNSVRPALTQEMIEVFRSGNNPK